MSSVFHRTQYGLSIVACGLVVSALGAFVQAGAIAHYPFDADFTDAANLHDLTSTGGGNTITGDAKFGAGAADFAGTDWLWNSSTDFEFGTNDYAIAFWYKNFHPDVNRGRMVTKSNTNLDAGWNIMITQDSAPDQVVADLNDFGILISAQTPADDDAEYHHVVVQRSGDNWEMYLDGSQTDTENIAGEDLNAPSASFAMGARNIDTSGNVHAGASEGPLFQGRLDEVWVFDQALSQAQIDSLIARNVIPEPSAAVLALAAWGLAGVCFKRRRT